MPAVDRAPEPRAIRIQGQRVTLRPMTVEDLPVVESWYQEAAVADAGACLLVITRRGDQAPVGVLAYRVAEPAKGWLTTAFVAIAAGQRGWGYGSEAVRLVEGWAAAEGVAARFRAEVDVGNGLGLYFWLRLGYRPVGKPGGSRDSITVARTSAI